MHVVVLDPTEQKFCIIRAQKNTATSNVRQLKIKYPKAKVLASLACHPNSVTKWNKIQISLQDKLLIQRLKPSIYQCINGYTLDKPFQHMSVEHDGPCETEDFSDDDADNVDDIIEK